MARTWRGLEKVRCRDRRGTTECDLIVDDVISTVHPDKVQFLGTGFMNLTVIDDEGFSNGDSVVSTQNQDETIGCNLIDSRVEEGEKLSCNIE